MKLRLFWIGKSKHKSYANLTEDFLKRLNHYCKYEVIELKESKKKYASVDEQKNDEAALYLAHLSHQDTVILLDENGVQMSSSALSEYIQQHQNHSAQNLCFLIGGAYGWGPELKKRADLELSLSKMTFTHDMARVLLTEQIYRAFTILRNEKYHNE